MKFELATLFHHAILFSVVCVLILYDEENKETNVKKKKTLYARHQEQARSWRPSEHRA